MVVFAFTGINLSAAEAAEVIKANKRFDLIKNSTNDTINSNNEIKQVYDKKLKRNRSFKNKIIVRFKDNTPDESIQAYFQKNNLKAIKNLTKRSYSCKFIQAEITEENLIAFIDSESDAVDSGTGDSNLTDLDIDEIRHLKIDAAGSTSKKSTAGSRTLVPSQWYLKGSVNNSSKIEFDINVDQAWNYTKGAGIKVAVIDTGFDLKHNDINYYNQGYDVVTNLSSAQAPQSSKENHGTAVAGIIAAKDNEFGVVGVAPEAQIIPIRLIAEDGEVYVSDIIDAHNKAIEYGATIINNSWGSYDPTTPDGYVSQLTELENQLYEELAEEANNGKGVVVIFAAGNSGEGNFNRAPEARDENNFAVGAIDSLGKRASYSVYGGELDVVAPGGDSSKAIVTTDRRDVKVKNLKTKKAKVYILGYDRGDYAMNFKGTSASAPVVAGIAALVWAANPNLSASEVKQIIKDSARKDFNPSYSFAGSGFNSELGYGLVDAGAAVEQALGN